MDQYYLNGNYLEEADAKISLLDLGLIRGYGVFDYLRTYNKKPFHLHEHLERLKFSAAKLHLPLPCPLQEIEEIVETMIHRSTHEELSIKIMITGGISPDHLTLQATPSLCILAYALKTPPPTFYSEGIAVVTTTHSRSIPTSKTLNYIPAIIALQQGKNIDAKEALYLNTQRELLEGTTSNIFAIYGKQLFTPCSEELLLGITREIVLNLAREDFEIHEKPISYDQLDYFDEYFLTSSSREIVPIIQIDHKIIGNGKPGPHTLYLQKKFAAYTQSLSWPRLRIERYE